MTEILSYKSPEEIKKLTESGDFTVHTTYNTLFWHKEYDKPEALDVPVVVMHHELFFSVLTDIFDNKSPIKRDVLKNSHPICPMGANRSPKIADAENKAGIELADETSKLGNPIQSFVQQLQSASVKNGKITIPRFQNPVEIIIIGMEAGLQKEELGDAKNAIFESYINPLLNEVKGLKSGDSISLGIIVVNMGDDVRHYYKFLRDIKNLNKPQE